MPSPLRGPAALAAMGCGRALRWARQQRVSHFFVFRLQGRSPAPALPQHLHWVDLNELLGVSVYGDRPSQAEPIAAFCISYA